MSSSTMMTMKPNANVVPSRQDLIMESINEFFLNNKDYLNQMLPILNQTAHISLRILDYFVTNYAKKKKIIYSHNDKFFNVFLNYKSQLKAYSKKQFDPFCRKMRKVSGKQIDESINFEYDTNKIIETTVGQLNFFKWAIENGVLAYIVDHLTDIVEDMILSSKEKKVEPVELTMPSVPGKKSKKKSMSGATTSAKNIDDNNKKTTDAFAKPQNAVTATKSITPTQKIKVVVSFS